VLIVKALVKPELRIEIDATAVGLEIDADAVAVFRWRRFQLPRVEPRRQGWGRPPAVGGLPVSRRRPSTTTTAPLTARATRPRSLRR
jgi:hypothetical protein